MSAEPYRSTLRGVTVRRGTPQRLRQAAALRCRRRRLRLTVPRVLLQPRPHLLRM